MVDWIIIGLYVLFLLFILSYSLIQLSLVVSYARYKRQNAEQPPRTYDIHDKNLPKVTVQLPVFNERYVVERLIDQVVLLDYPHELLEIQVLDDSTDDSLQLAIDRVNYWRNKGVPIRHVTRPTREGFKAGALAYGLREASGDFIAIFDADFLPEPDFLLRALPPFENPEVGMVQSRWEHLNRNYSMLTRLQAFGLDAHFTVEQGGRSAGGHFINFNGTGGVWRKTTIADAGGWSADTLTEDLDLSYRAQLKGWQFVFIESLGVPAELPVAMSALKTQQFRWNKGAAECARKNLGKVLKDEKTKVSSKFHAFFHLLNSGVFIAILGCALLSLPVLWVKHNNPTVDTLFPLGGVFFVSLLILGVYYYRSVQLTNRGWQGALKFFGTFPLFLSMTMGLALHNGFAVVEGYAGRKSPFLRTPKQGTRTKRDSWLGKQYLESVINPQTFLEGLMVLYFAFAIYLSFLWNDFSMTPLFVILCCGFAGVFGYSVWHSVRK